ncbi:hypothetical protein Tco_1497929, partial [Tanacetum coccineum]
MDYLKGIMSSWFYWVMSVAYTFLFVFKSFWQWGVLKRTIPIEDLPEYVMADILSAPATHGFPECIFPFEDLPGNVMVDILSRLP